MSHRDHPRENSLNILQKVLVFSLIEILMPINVIILTIAFQKKPLTTMLELN